MAITEKIRDSFQGQFETILSRSGYFGTDNAVGVDPHEKDRDNEKILKRVVKHVPRRDRRKT